MWPILYHMRTTDFMALIIGALTLASLARGGPEPLPYDYAARAAEPTAPVHLTYLSRPYDRAMAERNIGDGR